MILIILDEETPKDMKKEYLINMTLSIHDNLIDESSFKHVL